MDELLEELFGVHILEPLVKFQEVLKVKPSIRSQLKPSLDPLHYMRKIDKSSQ